MQLIPYSLYPTFIRPLLKRLDEEKAHGEIIKREKFKKKNPWKTLLYKTVDLSPVKMMGL